MNMCRLIEREEERMCDNLLHKSNIIFFIKPGVIWIKCIVGFLINRATFTNVFNLSIWVIKTQEWLNIAMTWIVNK